MVSPDIDVVDGRAAVGALELCFQTRGSRADPALLLIMGFGAQLTAWDESFVDAFVRRGFFVIRYDHRDVGLSSGVVGVPDLEAPVIAGITPVSPTHCSTWPPTLPGCWTRSTFVPRMCWGRRWAA
ncbi:alpha/beta fold hydrolase [Pseudonocardia dioxanivorans]|uniref:alpha/beta fold hydrolase n=1 Tax=Pseudonocardia dioxanivorans TaxID=240495 RepID=UPI00031D28CB|nr:hypothetical protein [Pseudonocardia dioxanivorans]